MQDESEYEERRRVQRIPTECGMHFRQIGVDKVYAGHCVNISGSGVLFLCDFAIPPGRALEIHTLPVCRSTPSITAFIEVIRCAEEKEGRFHIAGAIRGIKG
jgi:hypothetical protein